MGKGPLVENIFIFCLFWNEERLRDRRLPEFTGKNLQCQSMLDTSWFFYLKQAIETASESGLQRRASMICIATLWIWSDVLVTCDMMMFYFYVCKHPHADLRAWTHPIHIDCNTWVSLKMLNPLGISHDVTSGSRWFFFWVRCRSSEPRTCSWRSCSTRRRRSWPATGSLQGQDSVDSLQ